MAVSGNEVDANSRLGRLMAFLESDPGNVHLMDDAAAEAFNGGRPDLTIDWLGQMATLGPLSEAQINLRGLAELARQDFEAAAHTFQGLLANAPDEPALRFNLAWASSMLERYREVADLIDMPTATVIPRAAALKVEALHHLGELDEALAWGQACAELRPEDTTLMGVLSVAAFDQEDLAAARAFALKAGETHEGLSTLGMIALQEENVSEAKTYFAQALAANPNSARALLGTGLSAMLEGNSSEGPELIDRSAELFGDHLGTWVVAGWAHLTTGDSAQARERFEKALALDGSFAESHGALAVMDIIDGDLQSGQRRATVALRLDPNCLSGVLAKTLLLTAKGRPEEAEKVRNLALNTPLYDGGPTLGQSLARLGAGLGGPSTGPRR